MYNTHRTDVRGDRTIPCGWQALSRGPRERERERERESVRESERQRDRETERETLVHTLLSVQGRSPTRMSRKIACM
jgi:hypothetical protein